MAAGEICIAGAAGICNEIYWVAASMKVLTGAIAAAAVVLALLLVGASDSFGPADNDAYSASSRVVFTVLKDAPSGDDVGDAALRRAIVLAGLPWLVRHEPSGVEMVLVPAGLFRMGASSGDPYAEVCEYPARTVQLSRMFYMGRFEVTNRQMLSFDPHHYSDHGPDGVPFRDPTLLLPDRPAIDVDWFKAVEFCNAYGMRLPTEAEWEYACRGGAATIWPWGDEVAQDPNGMGLGNLSGRAIEAVGSYLPNRIGIFDMLGNAWEWCADWFAPDYSSAIGIDPRNDSLPAVAPDDSLGALRVIRGGCWRSGLKGCRCSARQGWIPGFPGSDVTGFRIVMDVPPELTVYRSGPR